tara:strand:- start:55 stop:1080 length:1026 start_codon:yes stop_codon:yes gene_type:complete
MAFLDNSGDIILDAVLTDEGRRRLAMGDGSFRITKFALGDDEIDYSLYQVAPPSGSGYQDTRILQLPVFEAFTNNTTSLKNRVLSYDNTSLLYLPVIKLNTLLPGGPTATGATAPVGGYYVTVDEATKVQVRDADTNAASSGGFRFAGGGELSIAQTRLVFDQGVDNQALSLSYLGGPQGDRESQSMFESAYLVEVDSRLLGLTTPANLQVAQPSFIDDDNVSTYYFGLNSDPGYFAAQLGGVPGGQAQPAFEIVQNPTRSENSAIGPTNTTGRLGSRLVFGLKSSLTLQNSDDLFTRLGGSETIVINGSSAVYKTINTVIRLTGFSTGYRVEIPIKLLKV